MSYRVDVRDNLRNAAAAELEHHDTYVALVSKAVVERSGRNWSDPVCLRFVPDHDHPGMLEIEVREVVRRG